MKKIFPSVFLPLFVLASCETVRRTQLPLTYPCSRETPCPQHSRHAVPGLLRAQMDDCGGRYQIKQTRVTGNMVDVLTVCGECGKERHFFFKISSASEKGEMLIPGFQHAESLFMEGQFQEAIPWLQDLVQIEPLFYDAHLLLAECFLKLGDLDGAEKSVKKMCEITTSDPDLYRIMASLAIGKGEMESYNRLMAEYRELFNLKR